MLGTSMTGFLLAFQREAESILKKTKGDMYQIVTLVLSDLQEMGLISDSDRKSLDSLYSDALNVLAGKKSRDDLLYPAHGRYTAILRDNHSSDVAKVLGELCLSLVEHGEKSKDSASGGDEGKPVVVYATTAIQDQGEQIAIWGAIGALVGGYVGGPIGAVVGAGVGAAVGACGDNPTTVTTNNGGNPA